LRRSIVQAVVAVGLVGLAIWLWQWSEEEKQSHGMYGGPLFGFTPAAVTALEIHRPSGVNTIERHEGGWRLTGQVTDLVDTDEMEALLAELVSKNGQPVLPGTEPDERRFGFGGEHSLELVFRLEGDRRQRLALGNVNPVSDLVYASGAGRSGVFGVGGGLFASAARLPNSVRLPQLLPTLTAADLDSLHLQRRGDDTLHFARLGDQRWWLRLPGGVDALVGKAARYHGRYDDRRQELAGASWFLADVSRLRTLVYTGTETDVVAFPAPGQDQAAAMAANGLEPAYRGGVFFDDDSQSWRVDFGEEFEENRRFMVAARRQGTLVIARGEAVHPFEGPLSGFLDLGALSFRPENADTLWIDEPDRPLLWGVKAPDPLARRLNLESIWDVMVPAGWQPVFGLETTADHISDLQTHLDRLPMVAVLEPEVDDPLQPEYRWRVRATLRDGRRAEVWLGRLTTDGRPAVWDPADGKVVVVPEEILVTLRSLRGDLKRL